MVANKFNLQPEKIRGADALFSTQPVSEGESKLLRLSQIDKPQKQPRRYFAPQKMELLVTSIKDKGVLEPLLVRPKNQDRYELIAGERRFRAAKSAGLQEIPCVIREMTDEEALEIALLENLQREDLNPVEETEGILELLTVRLNKHRQEVVTLLNMAANPQRQSVHNVMHSDDWQVIEALFTSLGRFTPNSFRANRLPLLKLPEDVLNVLQEGQIEYTKGKVIAQVKETKQRKELLQEAIANGLSLTEIKSRIRNLKADTEEQNSKGSATLKKRIEDAYTRVKKSKILDDPKKKRQAEKLLSTLEKLLSD